MLVIDSTKQDALWGIDTSAIASGGSKWSRIAALRTQLFGTPYNAKNVLVVQPAKQQVSGLDCTSVVTGSGKTYGVASFGTLLYAAPHWA